jgi:hypothetical protein
MRRALLICAVAACGPVNNYHPIHGGECPKDTGCEAPIQETARFEPPDDLHVQPPQSPETVEGIVAGHKAKATCASVANLMASLQLGNYADEDERAPVAGKYEQACVRRHTTLDELACLDDASSWRDLAYCTPQLAPNVPLQLVAARDCAAIATQIHDRFGAKITDDAALEIKLVLTSCEQDHWPAELGNCARTNVWVSRPGTQPLANCMYLAPRPLQTRITERFARQATAR